MGEKEAGKKEKKSKSAEEKRVFWEAFYLKQKLKEKA